MKKKSLLISAGTVIVVLLATLGSFFINKQRDERVQDIKPIKVVSRRWYQEVPQLTSSMAGAVAITLKKRWCKQLEMLALLTV